MSDAASLQNFNMSLSAATTGPEAMQALSSLAIELVGAKLVTVTVLDMDARLARRAYSNQPQSYAVSGTKPIVQNSWFEIVHNQKRIFVANTLNEIVRVFPDYEQIRDLGCESVINIPLFLKGQLAATLNLLHEQGHYSPARVTAAGEQLTLPAMAALLCWYHSER